MTTHDLVPALEDLGSMLAFPETPAFDGILPALPDRVAPARRRRPWLAIAAAIAAVVALVMTVPPARRAVADLLGIGAVRVTIVDELPETTAFKADLGTLVSLDEAAAAAPFPLLVPGGVEPDHVFLRDIDLVTVSQMFGTGNSPRLMLTQIGGAADRQVIEKTVPGGGTVEHVRVGDSEGLWLSGAPHTVSFITSQGGRIPDGPRLAGNTLIYEQDGVTIRIEADVDLPTALSIAESLKPVPSG